MRILIAFIVAFGIGAASRWTGVPSLAPRHRRCSPHRSDEYRLCFSRSPSEAHFLTLSSGLSIDGHHG